MLRDAHRAGRSHGFFGAETLDKPRAGDVAQLRRATPCAPSVANGMRRAEDCPPYQHQMRN
jgi:hypothetical protein